jgi:hypothetical protein
VDENFPASVFIDFVIGVRYFYHFIPATANIFRRDDVKKLLRGGQAERAGELSGTEEVERVGPDQSPIGQWQDHLGGSEDTIRRSRRPAGGAQQETVTRPGDVVDGRRRCGNNAQRAIARQCVRVPDESRTRRSGRQESSRGAAKKLDGTVRIDTMLVNETEWPAIVAGRM